LDTTLSIDNVNYSTSLNGYVRAEGRRLGVPIPVNDAVVAEVRRHGLGTRTPDPRNLEPRLAVLPR